ncbi:beta-lactamase family protein [Flavobacterium agricola]|uniref:Beta-lactamase family protein n=1 Tax=Flavobacterium agricola TaxID=2870839 RepID=A0ABY6LXS6_9FLAO|nr:serine hydrolase domain-containing protein [Flavobacterium agricola]UYW00782.1 beta-lactamase family protein [Flavobacterium agricola]
MKKILYIFLIISFSATAQSNISKIDSLLTYYNINQKMMGQYAIKLGNSTVLETAYGNKTNPTVKLNNESKFKIGDITKMFTATLILQLVDEKKLKLTDNLNKFYPKIPEAKQITIEMLLRHRSGLPDYVGIENVENTTSQQVLKWIEASDLLFEPGTATKFASTNYFLLGEILQQITQKTYNDNLIARICKPLNLYFTSLQGYAITEPKQPAASYLFRLNHWVETNEKYSPALYAANGIISNAKDLSKFIHGLFSYKLLKKETVDKMIETQNGFGLGITAIPFGDRVFYGHAGRIDANQTVVLYNPGEKLAYTALNNAVATNTNEINISVLAIYFNQPFAFPDFTDLEIPESILKNYIGIYKSDDLPIEIKVFIENGKLFAQAAGQADFPLAAKSETEFQFHPARIKITFKNNEFILNQSDANYLFTKQ